MADPENIELLRDLEFFRGIDERYLKELSGLCRQVKFQPRTTIFEEYDRAKEVYFIVDGRISLGVCDAQGCRQITLVGKGDLMGWSPLIGRSQLFDTARTATQVTTLVFDAEQLLNFCKTNAEFGYEFMRRAASVLGERLSATRRQLLEMSGVHFPEFPLESD